VLVLGAAGGVGIATVEVAKMMGATVIAAASTVRASQGRLSTQGVFHSKRGLHGACVYARRALLTAKNDGLCPRQDEKCAVCAAAGADRTLNYGGLDYKGLRDGVKALAPDGVSPLLAGTQATQPQHPPTPSTQSSKARPPPARPAHRWTWSSTPSATRTPNRKGSPAGSAAVLTTVSEIAVYGSRMQQR
jgi:hypothetical protein